jgi:hypothetical protein
MSRSRSGPQVFSNTEMRSLLQREVWECTNHATNPFFSVEYSEHNNPRKTQQPAVGTTRSLGKLGVQGRQESGGITSNLQFILLGLRLVTLLHCSNVDFNY